jgi:hypothetical protein
VTWICQYCETVNDSSADQCIACVAIRTPLTSRPVLNHPLLAAKQPLATGSRASSTPVPPAPRVVGHPSPYPAKKRGWWKGK